MNNEVEAYVGELTHLRKLKRAVENNRIELEKWIVYLDADVRQKPMDVWQREQYTNLKKMIEEILC